MLIYLHKISCSGEPYGGKQIGLEIGPEALRIGFGLAGSFSDRLELDLVVRFRFTRFYVTLSPNPD